MTQSILGKGLRMNLLDNWNTGTMLSPRNQAKPSRWQSLVDKCFSSDVSLCETWGGGVILSGAPTTLLDNWNTGTMLPLRRESKVLAWQDCLAKRNFKSGESLREARSGGSFPHTLLDNWITGTWLSPHSLLLWAAKPICLASQRFAKLFISGSGVMAFQNFKNFHRGLILSCPRQTGFTG